MQQQLELSRWMGAFHNNQAVAKPYVTPPIPLPSGGMLSAVPYSIALAANFHDAADDKVAPMAAIAHEGVLDELIIMPINEVLIRWAANTLIGTPPGLVGTAPMTMDGFIRWCAEPGEPKLHTCDHCDGTLLEPDEKPEAENMRMTCQHCDGSGLDGDISNGLAKIGPVTVQRYQLRSVYKHLRGVDVAMGWAPSTFKLGGFDAHVRAYSTAPNGEMVWGAWRILLADVVGGK